ncbi:MAG TPA: DASS family sodium-coupled anion symporter, partial [Patescibacteria group bacterium]|nr:DASS family sodium-coupled anion symporter [Patescibacteria group bacterium]
IYMETVPVTKEKFSLEKFRKQYGLQLAILLAAVVWFMGAPKGLSVEGHKAIVLFVGMFVLYLTEAIALPIASLAVVPLAVLGGIVKTSVALESFASTSVYLMVGAFILANAMVKSRLAERLTYVIMSIGGTSTKAISLGIVLANIVLAFLVPSSLARTAILLPVCMGIFQVFGQTGRSNFSTGMLLTLTMTNATMGAGILTATVPNPVTIDYLAKVGEVVTYGDWLLYGFPPALLMTIFTWWFIRYVFPPEVKQLPNGDEFVKQKLAELGPLSSVEKRAMLVFGLVVTLWATGGWTKIDPTIAALAGIILFFIPKFGFMTWADVNKNMSWQLIFVAGGGISLGLILMKTGAAKWFAVTIFSMLGLAGTSILFMLIVIMFVIQYMHLLFVGTTAMATSFIPIVMAMAETAHVNPLIFTLPAAMIIGGYPLLMFYSTTPNIAVYGTGLLKVEDFPKVGFVICFVAVIVYALCATTYWRWLGLF